MKYGEWRMGNEVIGKNVHEKKKVLRTFTDLDVWQKGHELVVAIYSLTKTFPAEEKYSIVSQLRRAAVSITSNIAEGFGRHSVKEKSHFYNIAHGSVSELQNQILISRDVGYITSEISNELFTQCAVVHKMITGLLRTTNSRIK